MSDVEMTGRRRYRIHHFLGGGRALVLQIEEHDTGTRWINRWRDATLEDLTEDERVESTDPMAPTA